MVRYVWRPDLPRPQLRAIALRCHSARAPPRGSRAGLRGFLLAAASSLTALAVLARLSAPPTRPSASLRAARASAKLASGKKSLASRRTAFIPALQVQVAAKENRFGYDALASGDSLYNYFRDYDPRVGRYVESDPIGIEGGINTYAYVDANPLVNIDPDGNLPQGLVNFAAGAGDTILLGFGGDIRDAFGINGGVDKCASEYDWGTWAGFAASFATGLAGGLRAAGTKGAGVEFSHWIPRRMGGPRSNWNGNYVNSARHYKHDPFRYPRGWRDLGPKWPAWLQQLDRTPNALKGSATGAAYGAAGKANTSCECNR